MVIDVILAVLALVFFALAAFMWGEIFRDMVSAYLKKRAKSPEPPPAGMSDLEDRWQELGMNSAEGEFALLCSRTVILFPLYGDPGSCFYLGLYCGQYIADSDPCRIMIGNPQDIRALMTAAVSRAGEKRDALLRSCS